MTLASVVGINYDDYFVKITYYFVYLSGPSIKLLRSSPLNSVSLPVNALAAPSTAIRQE